MYAIYSTVFIQRITFPQKPPVEVRRHLLRCGWLFNGSFWSRQAEAAGEYHFHQLGEAVARPDSD